MSDRVVSDRVVERLRVGFVADEHTYEELDTYRTMYEAADLIEAQQAEIERLRAAGDALAATWPEEDRCGCNNKDCRAVVAAYDAWREARRG